MSVSREWDAWLCAILGVWGKGDILVTRTADRDQSPARIRSGWEEAKRRRVFPRLSNLRHTEACWPDPKGVTLYRDYWEYKCRNVNFSFCAKFVSSVGDGPALNYMFGRYIFADTSGTLCKGRYRPLQGSGETSASIPMSAKIARARRPGVGLSIDWIDRSPASPK